MIEPSIHMNDNRKTVTFLLEVDYKHIFDDPINKAMFLKMQGGNESISEKLIIMSNMFKDLNKDEILHERQYIS